MDAATAIYYTLSTIAQTLAGALAVMVAVIVFRLQVVEDLIGAGDAWLHTWSGGGSHGELWPLLLKQGPAALRERMRPWGDPLAQVDTWQMVAGSYKAWHFRRKVTLVMYVTLGVTVAAVAICFAALPFTPTIASSPCLTKAVLAAGVGLALICLVLDVWLIARVVGRPGGRERLK